MGCVLVVDDSATDREYLSGLLERVAEWDVIAVESVQQAKQVLSTRPVELVITDLRMPGESGLDLVRFLKETHPNIPVILVTAFGSEDVAVRALRAGAASYVPKNAVARELVGTVADVLDAARVRAAERQVLGALMRRELYFRLPSAPELFPGVCHVAQDILQQRGVTDTNQLTRISVAIQEALSNAHFHGNLELPPEMRDEQFDAYMELARQRAQTPEFAARHIHVWMRDTPNMFEVVVRDEGPGFDVSRVKDPCDPANLERTCGRGLLLIHTFMDEVFHQAGGTQLVMRKYLGEPSGQPAPEEPVSQDS